MSISLLGALIHTDPEGAKKRILDAIIQTSGDRKAAAVVLGTTHRSLYRFIERLHLWDSIDRLIEENGFPKVIGPPRAAERIRDAVLAARGNLNSAARTLDMGLDSLRGRITELDLWDDLNRRLSSIPGCRPLKIPQASGVSARTA